MKHSCGCPGLRRCAPSDSTGLPGPWRPLTRVGRSLMWPVTTPTRRRNPLPSFRCRPFHVKHLSRPVDSLRGRAERASWPTAGSPVPAADGPTPSLTSLPGGRTSGKPRTIFGISVRAGPVQPPTLNESGGYAPERHRNGRVSRGTFQPKCLTLLLSRGSMSALKPAELTRR